MKLVDARRVAIEQDARIRFAIAGGAECTIDEHGVARVASLRAAPEWTLEEAFASAGEFVLEPTARGKAGKPQPSRRLSRVEFEKLCERKELAAHAAAGQDHDE